MKVYVEIFDLKDYEPGGESAKDTWDTIVNNGKGEEFIQMLEELYPEGIGDIELNDLLWHDSEWCLELVDLQK